MSVNNITAIILCGGKGKRLQSVVKDYPKPMAEVNNQPFISYLLKQLSMLDIKKVILATGFKAKIIENYFRSTVFGLDIQYSRETKPMGTGGAVNLALSKVRSDYILVMNGDSYIDVDLNKFIDWHMRSNYEASILLTNFNDVSRYGSIVINNKSRILSFLEKHYTVGNGLINTGVYFFKKNILKEIGELGISSLEKEFFPKLISEKKLFGKRLSGRFIDIGIPESYKRADLFFHNIKDPLSTTTQ